MSKRLFPIMFLSWLVFSTIDVSADSQVVARKQQQISTLLKKAQDKAAQEILVPTEEEQLLPGQIGLGHFVKLPGVKDVQISPDGKHLAIVHREQGEDKFSVFDADSFKKIGSYSVWGLNRAVGRVYWANNERLLYSVATSNAKDNRRFENGQLYAVNVDGDNHRGVFGRGARKDPAGHHFAHSRQDRGNHQIIDLLEDDPQHILVGFYPWTQEGFGWRLSSKSKPILFQVNIYTGKKRRLGLLPRPMASAITDNNGKVRFTVAVDKESRLNVFYKDNDGKNWQKWQLKDFEGYNTRPLSFSQDNSSVYLMANAGFGTQALYLFNLEKQTTKKLLHNEKVNISHLVWDLSGKQVIGISTELGLVQYQYINPTGNNAMNHRNLVKTFGNSPIRITSATSDAGKLIVYVYSDVNPGEYYLYDTRTESATRLIGHRDWIKPEQMASKTPLTIKTRDGQRIYGYITKPNSVEGPLPMVVLPHGGPHGVRDRWGFDWQVQLLANRGYAVLQVNYRGSDGFGMTYKASGLGQWGGLMQDDLTDATRAMIARGIADEKRVCMFGTSYGGYAALMGAVKVPKLYQCVIGSAGVYDLPMLYNDKKMTKYQYALAYLKEVLGDDIDNLRSRSPVFHADKVKAAVLLIHGTHDKRAPLVQAQSLKTAFDKIGKPYQWLEISNEGHGYYDESNRMTVYQTILAFLQLHIGQSQQK